MLHLAHVSLLNFNSCEPILIFESKFLPECKTELDLKCLLGFLPKTGSKVSGTTFDLKTESSRVTISVAFSKNIRIMSSTSKYNIIRCTLRSPFVILFICTEILLHLFHNFFRQNWRFYSYKDLVIRLYMAYFCNHFHIYFSKILK